MSAKAVQVSLDEDLLRSVDRDPEARRLGRSHVVASALRLYLQAKQKRSVDDAIRKAYASKNDTLLREVEGLMESQAWPND